MDIDGLVFLVQNYGYAALFFSLWLGIVGMPIPDEVIVMTGGLVASLGILKPLPAFFITYLGVVTGLTLGYILGRVMGEPIINRLKKRKNLDSYLNKSNYMISRYGAYSLAFSYFLPVVRHVIPYLVGVGKMPYTKYILFSYTAGFLWTCLFFTIGYFFGSYIEQIGNTVQTYGVYMLFFTLAALIIWVRFFKRNRGNNIKR